MGFVDFDSLFTQMCGESCSLPMIPLALVENLNITETITMCYLLYKCVVNDYFGQNINKTFPAWGGEKKVRERHQ